MSTQNEDSTPLLAHIRPVYKASGENVARIYSGDILISDNNGSHLAKGDLIFRFTPHQSFHVHLASHQPWLWNLRLRNDGIGISIPPNASLEPPGESALPDRPEGATRWLEDEIRITTLD